MFIGVYVIGCLFALIVLCCYYNYCNNVIEAYTSCDDVPNSVGCRNTITTSGNRCMWDENSKQNPGAETHCNSFDGVKIPSQCPNKLALKNKTNSK